MSIPRVFLTQYRQRRYFFNSLLALQGIQPVEGHPSALIVGAVIVLDIGAGLEIQLLCAPVAAQLLVIGAVITLAVNLDTEPATGGDPQLIAEALIQLHVFRQQDVLHLGVPRTLAQQGLQPTDTAQMMVLQLEQGIVLAANLVLAVDLPNDDLALARHLGDRHDRTQITVAALQAPVAQRTVGLCFPQLAARITLTFGQRALDRYPEVDAAIGLAAKILAVIAVIETGRVDQGRRVMTGNRQIPGGEVDHKEREFLAPSRPHRATSGGHRQRSLAAHAHKYPAPPVTGTRPVEGNLAIKFPDQKKRPWEAISWRRAAVRRNPALCFQGAGPVGMQPLPGETRRGTNNSWIRQGPMKTPYQR